MTQPGWYDNPDGSPNLRWWDGAQWTDHVQPKPLGAAQAVPGSLGAPSVGGPVQKKSAKWKIVVPIAVVALISIAAFSGGDEETREPSASAAADKSSDEAAEAADSEGSSEGEPIGTEANPAPVGTPVENKSARYTVTSVRTDTVYGSEFLQETAAGAYTIVSMTVENVKDSPIDFSAWDLTLLVDGVEYEVSDAVYSSTGQNDLVLADSIGPRLTIGGEMVFDVPPDLAGKGVLKARAIFSLDEPVYLSLQ